MKRSINVIFAISILLGNGPTLAATCKFADNTEDLFAGVTIVRTKWDRISPNWERTYEEYIGYVSASSEGENTFLSVRIRHLDQARFKPTKNELANALVVPEGTELVVIMADKTTVALPAAALAKGETVVHSPYSKTYNSDDYILITNAEVKYEVDAAAAEALVAQDATIMRMATTAGHHDIPMHKRSLDGIKNAISCLSSAPE